MDRILPTEINQRADPHHAHGIPAPAGQLVLSDPSERSFDGVGGQPDAEVRRNRAPRVGLSSFSISAGS
jgi:hypothetical protein